MKPSKPMRVVLVGAGYVAHHHMSALRRLAFVEVVGVCDRNLAAAEAFATRFAIPHAAANLAGLAMLRPAVVHVLTPPASHAAIALEALSMGCSVLVEKPMADSAAHCRVLMIEAAKRGLLLGVNHSDLYDPVLRRALDAARSGRIGRVLSVDVVRSSDYPPYAGGPLPTQVTQGSYPFRDLGVHGLYTLEAFLGEVRGLDVRFQASGHDPNLHFDQWQATAECANGTGRLWLSWATRPLENRLVVHGSDGRIEVDRFLQTCRVVRPLPGPKLAGILASGLAGAAATLAQVPWNVLRFATGRLRPSPGIQRAVEEFALAAFDNAAPPCDGEAALRVARLLDRVCAEPDRLLAARLAQQHEALRPADVLVTGGTGFLGSRLVSALRRKGLQVRVLARRQPPGWPADPGVQLVTGNLGDPVIVDHAVGGVATVYHLGAAMSGSRGDFEAGTVHGTRNVVAACTRHAARLVHVSSMGILDHAGRDRSVPLREDSMRDPHPELRGEYTRAKLLAEDCVRGAAAAGLPAVVVRPGQIFGPGAGHVPPNGVLALAGIWLAVGSGAQPLPLVYVDDVVDALLLAGSSEDATGRVFNIVDPTPISQAEYLRACRNVAGCPPVVRVPAAAMLALAAGMELLGWLLRRPVPLTRYRVRSLRPLCNFDLGAAARLGWSPGIGSALGIALTFGDAPPGLDAGGVLAPPRSGGGIESDTSAG